MPKKRKRRAAQRKRQDAVAGFKWLLLGLFAGLGIAAGIWLYLQPPAPRQPTATRTEPVAPPASEPQPDPVALEATGAGYDFYKMLPQQEVIVRDDFAARRESSQPARPRSQPLTTAGQYILQAGSYGDRDDAERVKATLALQGMRAYVEAVDVRGQRFHRVRVGPLRDLDQINDYRRRLAAASIDVLVLRIDGNGAP